MQSYRPFFDRLLRSAAAVTVSTPALQQLYARQSRQVVLMPNLLSRRLWGLPVNRQPADPGRVTVLYMGTKTHDADLAMVMPAFAALAAPIPGLRLRVVGGFAAVRADRPNGSRSCRSRTRSRAIRTSCRGCAGRSRRSTSPSPRWSTRRSTAGSRG